MRRILGGVIAACVLCAALAAAQDTPPGVIDRLTGTLKKIKDSGVVRLGYRENSLPFSFLDDAKRPVGYSIDLCNAIVEEVTDELGGAELRVVYLVVTPETRFALLQAGDIDRECGSTTANLERRKLVAFSPVMFITGTKLLVRKDSPIRSWRDLRGKTVAVTRGTTNAAAIQSLSDKQHLGVVFVTGGDHKETFELFTSGKADALANDEVLIYSMLAETRARAQFRLVGDFLSYDPYAIAYRQDDAPFATVVERTFRRLAESRELVLTYEKWFTKRLPSGIRLDLPISPQLEESFRGLGLPE
ncbi:MAG: amino acid ABC transporter substrate-binding protein [Betaproteobacteria bacterium]|nr:MAG: amino acid ABC transporter substrate-binding protein [Betaproteobacteria bacterium]